MRKLPVEMVRLIYSYDSTYPEYFTKNVLPEIEVSFWKKLFYKLTQHVLDFTNEHWECVSDFSSDDEDDEAYEDMIMYD